MHLVQEKVPCVTFFQILFLNKGRDRPPESTEPTSYWPFRSSQQNIGGCTLHIPSAYCDSSKTFYDPRFLLDVSGESVLSITDSPGWSDGTSLLDYYGSTDDIPAIFGGAKGADISVDQIHMLNTVKGMQDNNVNHVKGLVMVVTASDLIVTTPTAWSKLFNQFNTYRLILEKSGCLNLVITMTQIVSAVPSNFYLQIQTFLDNLEIILASMRISVRVYPFIINCQAKTDEEWFDAVVQSQRLIAHLKMCNSTSSPSDIKIFKDKPLMDCHRVQTLHSISMAKEGMISFSDAAYRISHVHNGYTNSVLRQAASLLSWKPPVTNTPATLDAVLNVVTNAESLCAEVRELYETLNYYLEPVQSEVMFMGIKTDGNNFYLVVHDLVRDATVYPLGEDIPVSPDQRISISVPYKEHQCELYNPRVEHLDLFNSVFRIGKVSFPSSDKQTFEIKIEKSTSWATEYCIEAENAVKEVQKSVTAVANDCESISDTRSVKKLRTSMLELLDICHELRMLGGRRGSRATILPKWESSISQARGLLGPGGPMESFEGMMASLMKEKMADNALQSINCAERTVNSLKSTTGGVSGLQLADMTGHKCLSELDGTFVDGLILTSFLPSYQMREILETRQSITKLINHVTRSLFMEIKHSLSEVATELTSMVKESSKIREWLYDQLDVTLYTAFIDVQKAFSVANLSAKHHPEDFVWDSQSRCDEAARTFQILGLKILASSDTDDGKPDVAGLSAIAGEALTAMRTKFSDHSRQTKNMCLRLGCLLDPRFPPYTCIDSRRLIDWKEITHLNNAVVDWLKAANVACPVGFLDEGGRNIPPISEDNLMEALATRALFDEMVTVHSLIKLTLRPVLKQVESRIEELVSSSSAAQQVSAVKMKQVVKICPLFPKVVPSPISEEQFKKIKDGLDKIYLFSDQVN